MPDQQLITDAKLDQQTNLLRWILGGVGTAVGAGALWMGAQFTQDKSFLREDVKMSLKSISESNASIAKFQETANSNTAVMIKVLEENVKLAREIRDDQRKFPAVAEKIP